MERLVLEEVTNLVSAVLAFLPSKLWLAKLVANSIASQGKTPLDVQMRAGNPAGATFQASFVIYAYAVLLQSVNICRAEIKAGL